MSHQVPDPAEPPGNRTSIRWRLVLFASLGLLLAVGLVGSRAYLKFRARPTGLEGTWQNPADPNHSYEFRANGHVAARYESLPMGTFMTWERDGQWISVRTERHWDFEGQLDGDEIRGKMIIRDNTGATLERVDAVWRRD